MKLSKLALRGFKSFAKPTEFCFEDGVTGLIGPNGCGKSNVVDAFKWVLGSRSAKALRGEEMLDVIFNGSNGVSSAGYAEVALSFSNGITSPEVNSGRGNDRALPLDYDEVTVTRRLYRSGESEYLLNNQACRLRDIRELFMDTGVGMESYSIIEQGGVDFVLQSNAHERRSLFEEAAGISKYKAKRREAQSKLERIEQDLLRLNDIIREVKREIRSIKIQATKAEKYKKQAEALKEKKAGLVLHQYHEYAAARDAVLKRKQDLSQQLETANQASKALVESIVEIEKQMLTLDNGLKAEQGRLISLSSDISTTTSEIENSRSRQTELAEEETKVEQGLAQNTQQTMATRNTLSETMQLLETVKKESEAITVQLEELTSQHKQITEELIQVTQSLETRRNDIFENTHKKSQYQNELTNIQAELRNLSVRRDKSETRDKEIDSELLVLGEAAEKLILEVESVCQSKEFKKSELAHQELVIKSLQEDLEAIIADIDQHQAGIHKNSSRLEILEDLEAHQAGLSSGVRAVLEDSKRPDAKVGTVYGILADLIEVEPKHVPAVEAGLGEFTQALITRTVYDSFKVIEFVRSQSKDRVTTISLDAMANDFNLYPSTPEMAGVLGQASQLVKTEPRFELVVEMLLGKYLLVENLDVARKVMESHQPFRPILTLTGEALTAEGVISGGTTEPGVSLLSRKTELKYLREELVRFKEKVANLTGQKTSKHQEIEEIVEAGQILRHNIYDQEVIILERNRALEEQQRRQELLQKEKEINSLELTEVVNQINDSAMRATSIAEIIKQLEEHLQSAQGEMERLNQTIGDYEERKKALAQQLTELKINQAQITEKKEYLTVSIKQLNEQIGQLEELLQATSDRISQLRSKITNSEETLKVAKHKLAELKEEQTRVQTSFDDFTQQTEQFKTDLNEKKTDEAARREKAQQVEANLNELTLQEQEHSLRMSNLDEKTREEIGVSLVEAYPGYTDDASTDWSVMAREIEEIRNNLGKINDVNLSAIDQLKGLEERADFLADQEQDLVKSKHSLQELIRKINRQSRERFQETFNKIQENFNQLFRKLFGGGKAELVLTDNAAKDAAAGEPRPYGREPHPQGREDGGQACLSGRQVDVLEAGIEIIAKPPGKEATKINQLSGGEKTLTALALIMSIFQLQPSPFCILDEADATLDETNVDRFVALVRDFAKSSQFIVITHNKKTMLGIDRLYGLTMQENSGISQKISVKMENK